MRNPQVYGFTDFPLVANLANVVGRGKANVYLGPSPRVASANLEPTNLVNWTGPDRAFYYLFKHITYLGHSITELQAQFAGHVRLEACPTHEQPYISVPQTH